MTTLELSRVSLSIMEQAERNFLAMNPTRPTFATLTIDQLRAVRGQRHAGIWNATTPRRERIEVLHFALNKAAEHRRDRNRTGALAFLAMAREARITLDTTN